MGKVLFVHDGPRWKNEAGEQFGSMADKDMYFRYKYLGDNVEFMMRVFKVKDTSKLMKLKDFGLHVHEITPFNRPKLLKNYFKSKKEIERQVDKADLIVVRLPSTIGSVALKYAKKINKPYVAEVVSCPWDALTNHSKLGKLYAPASRDKLKKLVADAKYVVYVTKQFLQDRYPTKYNSTNISNVILKDLPESNSHIARYENFDPKEEITFTTLGAVDIYKGQQFVIQALPALLKDGYKIRYNIVGGGDNSRLLQLAKDHGVENSINFTGRQPHEEIFNILDNTDLYLQPSDSEGLPRGLIEAMSRGCAAIGSRTGGIPELLNNDFIIEPKNVSDLTAKIRAILNKETLLKESKHNFEEAKEYSFEKLDARRKAFYDKFLQSINEK
jgi:glycosyltransferase involved in cell wall biosynthesis